MVKAVQDGDMVRAVQDGSNRQESRLGYEVVRGDVRALCGTGERFESLERAAIGADARVASSEARWEIAWNGMIMSQLSCPALWQERAHFATDECKCARMILTDVIDCSLLEIVLVPLQQQSIVPRARIGIVVSSLSYVLAEFPTHSHIPGST